MKTETTYTISNMQKSTAGTALFAKFDVLMQPQNWVINCVSIFKRSNSDSRWVALPSSKYEENGVVKFKDACGYADPVKQKNLKDALLAQFEKCLLENPNLIPEPAAQSEQDEQIPF